MSDKIVQHKVKTRNDIIDTALQNQQELKVLRYLLLLFVLTFVYEFGDVLMMPGNSGEVSVQDNEKPVRKIIPVKRIQKLVLEIHDLEKNYPYFHESLKNEIVKLNEIQSRVSEITPGYDFKKEFRQVLGRLWNYFHNPIWKDTTDFAAITLDISALFTLMKFPLPDDVWLPELKFGPRYLTELSLPKRDIFQYTGK